MGSEWRDCTWGDEISLEYGKARRDYKNTKGVFQVFGSNGPVGWLDDFLSKGPGIILGRKGAYRGVEYSKEPFWVIDTAFYVKSKKNHDMRWLYYAIKYYKLGEIDDGSPIPSTTRSAVYSYSLVVPPVSDQSAIAHILGSLDDKIELNRRMNETLEAIAQALFQSWFVDFDPVIDKALAAGKDIPEELQERAERRRALGDRRRPLPADVESLFPDEFEYTDEMGWVPQGWEVGLLQNIGKLEKRTVAPDDISSETAYIGLQDMPRKSISLTEWSSASEIESNKFKFFRGDLLFGKLRPYFHKVGIAPIDGVCSTDILVLNSKDHEYRSVLLGHITSDDFIDYVNRSSTGTKMPRTNWKNMSSYKVVIPSIEISRHLTKIVDDYIDRIIINIEMINKLISIRDSLLPKLISGELQIPDVEKLMEGLNAKN